MPRGFLRHFEFIFLLGLILLSALSSFSQVQHSVLHGVVSDPRGNPLATVAIKTDSGATVSNDKGEFTLELTAPATIRFSLEGYFPVSQKIDPAHAREISVVLTPVPTVRQEVKVTAPRLEVPLAENPAAMSIVGEDVLVNTPRAIAAEESLVAVPGMKVDNQANQERVHISIRGQGILTERGVRGIGVLLDGVPMNDPSGFAPDLFDVDWSDVQQINVLRGPVGFLYGGSSSGGIIDIATETPTGQPHGTVALSGGSNSFYKAHSDYGGVFGKTALFLSLARAGGDGYRVHTRFYGNNLYGKANVRVNPRLQLNFIGAGTGYFNQNPEGLNLAQVQQEPRQPNPDALTYNEYQKTRRGTGAVTGQFAATDSQNLSFVFYARRTSFDESVPSSVMHRTFTTPGVSGQYDLKFTTGGITHYLSSGVDLDSQGIDDTKYPNLGNAVEGDTLLSNQHITQRRVGGFLSDRLALGRKWSVLGGVRWDQIRNELEDHLQANGVDLSGEEKFHRATGRVGVSFNPRNDFAVYGSWGQGFLPPATEELYANPDAQGGFNLHLKPATSWGYEGGIRGGYKNRVWYNVTAFHLETSDDFERYRMAGRPLETFYGNAGDSSRNGIETEVRWAPVPRMLITGAFTYSHFAYTRYTSQIYPGDLTGNWLPNSPNHQFYVETGYQLPRNLFASISVQALSRAFIDPTNVTYIDGYGLLGAKLNKEWRREKASLKLFVAGRNLTGTEYIAFTEPDPDGNSYQPGPVREVFGGMELRF